MWPRQGATALVIGAGGQPPQSRWRSPACRCSGSASRHAARAPPSSLAERLAGSGDVAIVAWDRDAIAATCAHSAIVVNATPAGLGDLPFDPRAIPQACSVVDLRYGPRPVDVVDRRARDRPSRQ